MLYEFAMTPDLFDSSVNNTDNAGTILIQLLRGLAENGLLANLHKDRWVRHIEQRIDSLTPPLKDQIKSCLTTLDNRHRLVRHPKCMSGNPSSDLDWLNLALESHQRIAFHAIFLSHDLIEKCGQKNDAFVEFLNSLNSQKWLEVSGKHTHQVEKTVNGFRQVLAPILRHAKSLSLVDAYMNYHELRFFNTIKLCSELMGQRGHARLSGRIHIHAEGAKQKPNTRTIQEHLNVWEQNLLPLVQQDGHRFKVFLWENQTDSQTMYDSYILTDQCGVFLHRLDCRTYSQANITEWNLLDEDARTRSLANYDPASSPFILIGEKEIQ
ncbi:MAG: hypothetical protein PHW28_05480 [Mesotoga sp.]|nr:hypothetical protein [Mesotoga sp.]